MKKKAVKLDAPLPQGGRSSVYKPKLDRDGYVRCRVCGCTEREPCNPPCAWIFDTDICDSCHFQAVTLMDYYETAHRPSIAALLREVKRRWKLLGAGAGSRNRYTGPLP